MTDPRTLYLDCFAGISGDMFLALLLDLGFPEAALRAGLAELGLSGWELALSRGPAAGIIAASGLTVTISKPQPPRPWREIRQLLAHSALPATVRDRALAVFANLAAAEARVHGCPEEEVHFHELGAVDTLIDIVGATLGLEFLGIEHLHCSPLPLGRGMITCAHGQLPLPAPATCELLRDLPVYGVELAQELVTPTGAALVKTLAAGFGPFPAMTIARVGYGRGSQQLADGRPNLVRGVLGQLRVVSEAQEVVVISCNLDDWSPEGYPWLCERLFAAGALDVLLLPAQMKKGRPGFLLQVLCPPGLEWPAQRLILSETSAIGLRRHREERWTLPRRLGTVATELGLVKVKRVEGPSGVRLTPEYEDCRRLARASGRPLPEIYAAVLRCRPEEFQEDVA
ncbi:MAG: nickel pincer cofactor biosynthesis protein LarC [Desulfobulbaceae bacterium]|nr:nickel pincer cofactor biosynthesis protein LarC [Desulfobulbaceae bacterium]